MIDSSSSFLWMYVAILLVVPDRVVKPPRWMMWGDLPGGSLHSDSILTKSIKDCFFARQQQPDLFKYQPTTRFPTIITTIVGPLYRHLYHKN